VIQTDMTTLIVVFRWFGNAPKKRSNKFKTNMMRSERRCALREHNPQNIVIAHARIMSQILK
jgi:hypothetical protein